MDCHIIEEDQDLRLARAECFSLSIIFWQFSVNYSTGCFVIFQVFFEEISYTSIFTMFLSEFNETIWKKKSISNWKRIDKKLL